MSRLRVPNWLQSRWFLLLVPGLLLFGVVPWSLKWFGWASLSEGIYIGTGIVVLWYTVETFLLRREMVRQNDISLHPVVTIVIDEGRKAPLKLRNLGRGVALYIEAKGMKPLGSSMSAFDGSLRFKMVDLLESGTETYVTPVFRSSIVDGRSVSGRSEDASSYFLPSAKEDYEVTLTYVDSGGASHESVMHVGRSGVRLIKHS